MSDVLQWLWAWDDTLCSTCYIIDYRNKSYVILVTADAALTHDSYNHNKFSSVFYECTYDCYDHADTSRNVFNLINCHVRENDNSYQSLTEAGDYDSCFVAADWVCVCHTLYDNHRCSRWPPPALSLQKVLHYQETNNNPVFLIWLHFYNPTSYLCVPIPYLSSHTTSVV